MENEINIIHELKKHLAETEVKKDEALKSGDIGLISLYTLELKLTREALEWEEETYNKQLEDCGGQR